ncbi:imelysin family protein [Leptospira dzoumogneensis]|uniref:Imelysin n=1 Tax=Leptospira dzoumogneensis TaxID=2484904 RepID=A0A4Z1AR73_9LEPT|nr:imelysin family protein [Leptospira dzoumogneensis]TGN04137.1 imelysin [Leptospira dzoumogneensis]
MRQNNSVRSGRFGRFFRIKKLILTAWIILSILLLSIFISCSHKNSASGAANTNGYLYQMFNSFDPRSLLQNLGNNIIPPLFVNLKSSSDALVAATDDLCASDSLSAAQAAWVAHKSDLKKVEPFRFGTTLAYFTRMDPFLINYLTESSPNTGELDDLDVITTGDISDAQQAIGQMKNKAKGISAIEYILFSRAGANRGTAPSCGVDFSNAPDGRAALLRALVLEYSGHVQNVTDAWKVSGTNPLGTQLATAGNGTSATFPSSGIALDVVLSSAIQLLSIMKDGKLEIPEGLSGGGNGSSPNSDRAESRFSGRSFDNLIDNLSTFKAIYTGNGTGAGLKDYVKFYSPDLAEEIDGEIAELEEHLGDITPSTSNPPAAWGSANATNFTAIKSSINDLSELLKILNTELAALTGSSPVSGGPGGDGD